MIILTVRCEWDSAAVMVFWWSVLSAVLCCLIKQGEWRWSRGEEQQRLTGYVHPSPSLRPPLPYASLTNHPPHFIHLINFTSLSANFTYIQVTRGFLKSQPYILSSSKNTSMKDNEANSVHCARNRFSAGNLLLCSKITPVSWNL